jgi:hypothetical protein
MWRIRIPKRVIARASLSGSGSFTDSIDEHGKEPSLSWRAHDTQITSQWWDKKAVLRSIPLVRQEEGSTQFKWWVRWAALSCWSLLQPMHLPPPRWSRVARLASTSVGRTCDGFVPSIGARRRVVPGSRSSSSVPTTMLSSRAATNPAKWRPAEVVQSVNPWPTAA